VSRKGKHIINVVLHPSIWSLMNIVVYHCCNVYVHVHILSLLKFTVPKNVIIIKTKFLSP
jgi:hypothetical protein